jgi:hypothetical protein
MQAVVMALCLMHDCDGTMVRAQAVVGMRVKRQRRAHTGVSVRNVLF